MAIYYFRNTGDANWGTSTNWSLTDGGGATGAVPTVNDDAYFTSNSGNCTINTSNRLCKSLVFSGVGAGNYSGTLTMTFNISVAGNVTLSSTMNISGAGALIITTTSTLTPNGKTWPSAFSVQPSGIGVTFTITLAGPFIVEGTFSHLTGSGASVTFNGNSLTLRGNLSFSTSFIGGTTNVIIAPPLGTTRSTLTVNGFLIANPLEFNGEGTFNFTASSHTGSTLTYTNGSFNHTSGTFSMGSINATWDTDGMSFNALSVLANNTTTNLLSEINCRGNFYVQTHTFTGAFNVNVASLSAASGGCAGGTIVFRTGTTYDGVTYGSGTWTGVVNNYSSNIIIAGNPTIGNVGMAGGTLTYQSGIPIFNGTFVLQGSVTLNTSGMSFNILNVNTTVVATANITINSLLTVSNLLSISQSGAQTINFLGSFGFITASYFSTFAGGTVVLTSGNTYSITSSLTAIASTTSAHTIRASLTDSTKAVFNLSFGASQSVFYINGTDIDSSGGQTIWSLGGTLTRTINWSNGQKPGEVAYTYII
jgi:hypothetical protein